MIYSFNKMSQPEALVIANEWKYDGEYSFYDMTADEEDYNEFVTPKLRHNYYCAYSSDNKLCGFLTFEVINKTADIGIGLSPNMTGQGKGFQFLSDCISFIEEHNTVTQITLSVAAFNKRAIKLYIKYGFEIVSQLLVKTNGGEHEFVAMSKNI